MKPLAPFNPNDHFTPNDICPTCTYHYKGECAAVWPEQCPAAAHAAFAYITHHIPEPILNTILRTPCTDEQLATTLAAVAGLDIESGRNLRDAFLFWTSCFGA